MLNKIKNNIPTPIKKKLIILKSKFNLWSKNKLMHKMEKRHNIFIKEFKNKQKIKVVFIVIHKSVWKVDSVFKKMLVNPLFEPLIMVCPDIVYDEEHMWSEMASSYDYFKEKRYPLISAYDHEKKEWIKLESIKPDIIFFTNPHKLTRKEYYEDAYLNYLSCYVPYHHEIVNNIEQYNQQFHVAQWKIFATSSLSKNIYNNFYPRYGKNVLITGYPVMEELIEKQKNKTYIDVWKTKDNRLRIIWAPHHSVEQNENVPYSNFIQLADVFKEIAKKYKDKIVWSFKPHPLLKIKLYELPEWGKERTNSYYDFWKKNEYTQLDQGEYIDLFCSSDAMIHDSGSFLAEYLYVKKPVLYILSEINNCQFYSDFGLKALDSCQQGKTKEDIIEFLESLLKTKENKNMHKEFLDETITPYFNKEKPSDKIIKAILDI